MINRVKNTNSVSVWELCRDGHQSTACQLPEMERLLCKEGQDKIMGQFQQVRQKSDHNS